MTDSEPGLFETRAPNQGRCCLCGGIPTTFESRNTGPACRVQRWPFCQSCWDACQVPSTAPPAVFKVLIQAIFQTDPRMFQAGAVEKRIDTTLRP
jgi:hypothetical protein